MTSQESEGTVVAAEIAAAVDATVNEPVLVVGSLPPFGRDLDVLAGEGQYARLVEWLTATGFLRWRDSWARIDGTSSYGVELSSFARWRLGTFDVDQLLRDAGPIPGYRNLVQPSPATVLLIASRGTLARRGRLTDKRRRRVAAALERDPQAWVTAEELALDLGMVGAVRLLRRAYDADRPLLRGARAAGLAAVLLQGGPLAARGRVLLSARPRRMRPTVVSFSGLDGSGKSTQMASLRDTLDRLGVTAEVQWVGFKNGSTLRSALPILDRSVGRAKSSGVHSGLDPSRDPLVPDAVADRPLAQQLWTAWVLSVNTVGLWQHVLKRRTGSKVVIFDRFSPDSAVKIDLHYGVNRHYDVRWQRALFARIAPKPDIGFLLDVPPDVAYARRQDQTPEELAVMSRLYDDQVRPFGLVRLDGTRTAAELRHEVAVAAWQRMR